MLMKIRRLLRRYGKATGSHVIGHMPLRLQRRYAEAILQGCCTDKAAHLRRRIAAASDSSEIWRLRPEVFQTIAESLGESEATGRLRSLERCIAASQW